ncbi:hypothetical protein N9B31_03825 [Mariniblastus sp.]|nr:hypothetical protein [Mariniblastus sp.]MDB4374399.1 hypothetical protein [bacterium]MDA7902767.1 hypothetical protein [Mariniblastus sp.]MDA7923838.1 hypothetical protein [Mariniblastus sp.]MDA7928618.1 hypothetical protein [Mariniblastus sp.]
MKFGGDNLKDWGKASFNLSLLILAIAFAITSEANAWQSDEVENEAAPKLPVPLKISPKLTKPDTATQEEDEPEISTTPRQSEQKPIGKQFAQLHLMDGSIIGGDFLTVEIDVKTNYGMLKIPISRIVRFQPGLNTRPDYVESISLLFEKMGDADEKTRIAAQKELIALGLKNQNLLDQLATQANDDQKKLLSEIRKAFEEQTELNEEEMLSSDQPSALMDTIVTPDFSVVGEIQQKQFSLKSKFGDLKVELSDIDFADRSVETTGPDVRKTVSVPAEAFFQRTPKSTKIRVNKGDRITIRGSGTVQWANFNNTSSPEGLTNRSQWNGINSGKLTARIGTDNSRCVAIGNDASFVAKSSGILYLGIAMRDSYATNGNGYRWTGEYQAKIVVSPAKK